VRAFDVHAVDYVLKPFDDARFEEALGRAKTRVREASVIEAAGGLSGLLEELSGRGEHPRRISIHKEGRVELIDVDGIRWVEAADQYVCLHTESGECLMRESMGRIEKLLDPARFMRVHRSAIVALDLVRSLESAASGNARLQLTTGEWLPVSRSRVSSVRKRLG
jgi:two-component system LytT family response regulator